MRPLPFFVTLLSLLPATLIGAAPSPIRVLLVDGFSNHNWQLNTALIREILEPTGLFRLDVSTAPPNAAAPGWSDWRPQFADYDVVIQTCNDIGGGPSWPEAVQADFEAYVQRGGGVFIYHSGNNAFPNWNTYNRIIGLGWRRADQGVALTLDEAGIITRIPSGEDRGTGHGPRSDVVLTRRGEHPIHRDLPRRWKVADIEVYHHARGPAENVEVLSYAFDASRTQMHWPIEWTVQYGEGRVYTSTLGHVWRNDTDPISLRCVGMRTLMIRALEWLADRPVTYPVPADFPSEHAVSVRPAKDSPEASL